MNFVSKGSVLYYGQKVEDCTLGRLWNELKSSCDFINAQKEVENFNRHNRWKKRGIAMVPTNLGISFTTKFVNQEGEVYTDGTVLVTHGGVEMGQGLHTKLVQIAASSFNIPLNAVFISETTTDKVPNASATAAAVSSDLYGAAVLDACKQLKARMEPIASKNNFSSFAELVSACYMERIDLSAYGFFVTPDIGFDWESGKDRRRFSTGSGMGSIRRAEMGRQSTQMDSTWLLNTSGPGSYKLPSLNDVPKKFNVSLLKNAPNAKAIHFSKAVGEPPFFLASSVFFAIKNAIKSARMEAGYNDWFPLDNPATPERIRMACTDEFTRLVVDSDFRPKLSV